MKNIQKILCVLLCSSFVGGVARARIPDEVIDVLISTFLCKTKVGDDSSKDLTIEFLCGKVRDLEGFAKTPSDLKQVSEIKEKLHTLHRMIKNKRVNINELKRLLSSLNENQIIIFLKSTIDEKYGVYDTIETPVLRYLFEKRPQLIAPFISGIHPKKLYLLLNHGCVLISGDRIGIRKGLFQNLYCLYDLQHYIAIRELIKSIPKENQNFFISTHFINTKALGSVCYRCRTTQIQHEFVGAILSYANNPEEKAAWIAQCSLVNTAIRNHNVPLLNFLLDQFIDDTYEKKNIVLAAQQYYFKYLYDCILDSFFELEEVNAEFESMLPPNSDSEDDDNPVDDDDDKWTSYDYDEIFERLYTKHADLFHKHFHAFFRNFENNRENLHEEYRIATYQLSQIDEQDEDHYRIHCKKGHLKRGLKFMEIREIMDPYFRNDPLLSNPEQFITYAIKAKLFLESSL
jgi:hypothetical protein